MGTNSDWIHIQIAEVHHTLKVLPVRHAGGHRFFPAKNLKVLRRKAELLLVQSFVWSQLDP